MLLKTKFNFNYAKLSALGFLVIIFIGAVLLSLPISSRNGEFTPFIDALFTSTSATCVTGLVVYDTYSHFSVFGQSVILILIQVGGLGFMIITTMFLLVLRKRIGIRERGFLKESISSTQMGGVVRLAKHILIGTFILEGIGTILLSIKFGSEMGVLPAIFNGIFHSVSAFCNAGFDLMGRYEEYSSLTRYSGDIVINLVVIILIVVGGIGFIVWEDIYKNKNNYKKYQLHSKIVITTTFMLILCSAIIFYFTEKNNILANVGTQEAILSSFFQVITPRTAGFNTVDIASLSEGSKLLTMLLMVIGGSPGSTAGGIKTTTFVVAILTIISSSRHSEELNIFGRRLEVTVLKRACSIITTYLLGSILAILLISFNQPGLELSDIAFEVLSAIGTVGMSVGITGQLSVISKLVIITLMFCGRIGSLAVIMTVARNKESVLVKNPMEKIIIG